VHGPPGTLPAISVRRRRCQWNAEPGLELARGSSGLRASLLTSGRHAWQRLANHTVEVQWRLPGAGICAITNSRLLLVVNGQLALIDLETGRQISYSEDSVCPTDPPGGMGVSSGSGSDLFEAEEVTVTRFSSPGFGGAAAARQLALV